MSAKKIQKSTKANFSSDNASFDLFVTSDAEHCFANFITGLGWEKLARHPASYNSQIVKEFYANLTNPSQKKRKVVVRGKRVLYSDANINKYFHIKVENDAYQATLELSCKYFHIKELTTIT
ncbi:hypothetical protein A2U01_0016776 [Trifolium medium]|uniref:Putative plant transposon protein domain-containing protein n=1 Tax=Trifolium medium TaxID=97028 RepID=A0A392NBE0_9FABA|nr:hypothetical protein [Trifolium medium]